MNKLIPEDLLEKYLCGNCSAEETTLVKEWYESFEQELNHIDTLDAAAQQQLEVKIYNGIIDSITVVEEQETRVSAIGNRKTGFWYKMAGAAAVLIMAAAAGLLIKGNTTKKDESIADNDAQQIIVVTNNSNHIYKSILPDNSVVWLSPHAALKYPKVFESKSRLVTLNGEGFFEVTKNPDRPFIITSHTLITKVWGTSFLVRDNTASGPADVSVLTGKVSVSIKKKSNKNLLSINKDEIMLHPEQKATYIADAQVLKSGSTNNNPELKIWKHANLFFDNKSLKDIIPVLNATYNTRIKVANEKLNHYLLNADFSGLNLPDVLEALSKSLNIDYSFINNTIELTQSIN